jgi:predicted AlkP superfamily phosphohydrolase/phosphomutase
MRRGVPIMDADSGWEPAVLKRFSDFKSPARKLQRGLLSVARRLRLAKGSEFNLDWMPATHYRRFWRHMPAFALPAYYEGYVRLNLAGREKHGVIPAESYDDARTKIEKLVGECTDPVTGKRITAEFIRPKKDKFDILASEADLLINWDGAPLAMEHPTLGRIGPIPYRRVGGHTGKSGVAFFSDRTGLEAVPSASSFDVVPTVIGMLGLEPVAGLSGRSLT